MTWARLDDQRHQAPNVLGLGDDIYALAAVGLLDHAITWACGNTKRGTPEYGFVPWAFWKSKAGKHTKRLTELLIREGHVAPDPADRGLFITDFGQYGAKRDPAEAAESGRRGGSVSRPPGSKSLSNSFEKAQANGQQPPKLTGPSRTYARTSPVPGPVVALGSLDGPLSQVDACEQPDHQSSKDEQLWAEQLAIDVHAIRPTWQLGRIRTAIADAIDQGVTGPYRLTIAMVFIAIAEDSTSPRRVLCDGWWFDENDSRYLQMLDHPTVHAFLERSAA